MLVRIRVGMLMLIMVMLLYSVRVGYSRCTGFMWKNVMVVVHCGAVFNIFLVLLVMLFGILMVMYARFCSLMCVTMLSVALVNGCESFVLKSVFMMSGYIVTGKQIGRAHV